MKKPYDYNHPPDISDFLSFLVPKKERNPFRFPRRMFSRIYDQLVLWFCLCSRHVLHLKNYTKRQTRGKQIYKTVAGIATQKEKHQHLKDFIITNNIQQLFDAAKMAQLPPPLLRALSDVLLSR